MPVEVGARGSAESDERGPGVTKRPHLSLREGLSLLAGHLGRWRGVCAAHAEQLEACDLGAGQDPDPLEALSLADTAPSCRIRVSLTVFMILGGAAAHLR